ncbi:phosphatase PAP2 family protein [Chitinolyticbacter meiyuanensis]|uniref:phosphatase PAP2 family protein n=1 Tax=Chitinolyticbacter meiyuanensis TaxID=682798 RepID=UPI001FE3F4EB|nr:phosphatase PAP2 family protein [Chitinolyticbacter meiyuanensis]
MRAGALTAAIAALLYLLLAASLSASWLGQLDTAAFAWLYDARPGWVATARALGLAGSLVGTLLVASVLGWLLRQLGRPAWPGLPLFLLGTWGVNWLLKYLTDRPRPALEALMHTHSSSFPSGHAMAAAALGLAAAGLLARRWPHHRQLWWALGLAWLLAGGLARVVLGVHHFSDIMAGYMAAVVLVAGFHFLASRYCR